MYNRTAMFLCVEFLLELLDLQDLRRDRRHARIAALACQFPSGQRGNRRDSGITINDESQSGITHEQKELNAVFAIVSSYNVRIIRAFATSGFRRYTSMRDRALADGWK